MKKVLLSYFVMSFFLLSVAFAQNKAITGKVTSATDGTSLPGVSVTVKGNAKIGTQTDVNGNFKLSVPADAKTLVFSYIGFKIVELPISTTVNVKLQEDQAQLSEVVVNGYTSIQRSKFSGSTVTISGAKVATPTFGSFDQALQGAAAGVTVIANGGQPGQNAVVRIRGNGSINGSNVPLYIVDGIEVNAADFQSMNQGDFDNVEILKDAVSTGVYGSRGSNGVFVITTKKGKAGQIQLNYDSQFGTSTLPEDKLLLMNSDQKITYELQRGNPYGWTAAEQAELRAVNFNWQDELFRTAKTQQHQVSASGGTEASKFYASLSYLDQEGIVKTTGLKRYTARANVDNVVKNFKFGLGVQGGFSNRNNTEESNSFLSSPLNAARWSNPYERAFGPDGDFNESGGKGTGQLTSTQPNGALNLALNRNNGRQVKGVATSYLEFRLPSIKGLYARTNWGIDYTQNEGDFFTSPRSSSGIARQGILSRTFNRNFRYTGTTSINYSTTIKKHEISGGVFTEVVKNDFRSFGFTGYGFTNGFTNEAGITPGAATTPNFIPAVAGNGTQNGLLSFFALANYGYNGKYFLNVVGRRDGSSRFGSGNRFANFGSAGVSWLASEEEFIKNISSISDLRLRVSYGTTGNQGTGDFPLAIFGRANYAGVGGFSPSSPGNSALTWETSTTLDAALDFGLFKNRLFGTIEYYNRVATDQLYDVPVDPSGGGFTSITANFGSLRNRGIEFSLSGDVIKTSSFSWTLGGNITYNKNEILDLPTDNVIQGVTILREGSPVNSLFLVPFAGVDPATGNALYRKLDGTITPTYSVNDKVIYGTSDAPLYGAINSNVRYKGFDLSAQVNFFEQRQMYNSDYVNVIDPTYYFDNVHIDLLNEWTPSNTITNVPRPSTSGGNFFRNQTDRFLDDADFWRLRNVMLGYTFAKPVLDAMKIRSARLFLQGQNLLTGTKFRSFDPEATGTNLAGAQYPSLKQVTFGLSIGF
jgi:TonB-linked SusC/RagA family outer membrane protein